MPRYFFHLKYETRVVLDEEGIFLRDLDTARAQVMQSIQEILDEPGFVHEDVVGQKLEIADESGETVMIVPF